MNIEVFKMRSRHSTVSVHELFTLDADSKGTTGHWCKLVKTRCSRDITKYFFSNKVINRWNLLDQRTVDAPSINAFKSRLVQQEQQDGLFHGLVRWALARPYWLDNLSVRLHKVNDRVITTRTALKWWRGYSMTSTGDFNNPHIGPNYKVWHAFWISKPLKKYRKFTVLKCADFGKIFLKISSFGSYSSNYAGISNDDFFKKCAECERASHTHTPSHTHIKMTWLRKV